MIYTAVMQTVTIELTNDKALKALQDVEEKYFIKIIPESDRVSDALAGRALTNEEFTDLILGMANGPTVSLKDAKAVWAKQRKQLQKLSK